MLLILQRVFDVENAMETFLI